MSDATLAIGAAEEQPQPKALLFTTALASGAVFMALLALVAGYLEARSRSSTWPPEEVVFNNYIAVMLTLTSLMSAATVGWARSAHRRDERRQLVTALWLTLGFGLTFLNGLAFLISELNFGPGDHRYGSLFYALVLLVVANTIVGLGGLAAHTLRTLGWQMGGNYPERLQAISFYWQFVVVIWLIVYSVLYLFK